MILSEPLFLWLGIGAAMLVALGVISQARRRRRLAAFLGGRSAARRLAGKSLYGWRFHRLLLLALAAIGIGAAAAEPRVVREEAEVPELPPAPSVIFVIDISASMQARDVSPTRLGGAVARIRDMMTELPDHEIGLVLSAGTAYPLAPPSPDHRALRYLLDGVTPTIASAWDPGSQPSEAIRTAIRLFSTPDSLAARSIIFASDGEAGERNQPILAAISDAREAGITVHTMGVGSGRGAGMSIPDGQYQVGGPVLTESGARAISRLREASLQEWAEAGGGLYANVAEEGASAALLEALIPEPAPMVEEGPEPILARIDLGALLTVVALLLLLIESLFDVRIPGRWLAARRTPAPRPIEVLG